MDRSLFALGLVSIFTGDFFSLQGGVFLLIGIVMAFTGGAITSEAYPNGTLQRKVLLCIGTGMLAVVLGLIKSQVR